ncbi:hypothetical protein RB596_009609 [Gaeumannomyces avenae]
MSNNYHAQMAARILTEGLEVNGLCAVNGSNLVTYKESFRRMEPSAPGRGNSSTVTVKQLAHSWGEIQVKIYFKASVKRMQVATITFSARHCWEPKFETIWGDQALPTYLRNILWSEVKPRKITRAHFKTPKSGITVDMNDEYLERKVTEMGEDLASVVEQLKKFRTEVDEAKEYVLVGIDLFIPTECKAGATDTLDQLEFVVLAPARGHPGKDYFRASPRQQLIDISNFEARAGTSKAPDPARNRWPDQGSMTLDLGRAVIEEDMLQRLSADKMRQTEVKVRAVKVRCVQGHVMECLLLANAKYPELLPRMDQMCKLKLVKVSYKGPELPDWPRSDGEESKVRAREIIRGFEKAEAGAGGKTEECDVVILKTLARLYMSDKAPKNMSEEERGKLRKTVEGWYLELKPRKTQEDGAVIRETRREWKDRVEQWAFENKGNIKTPDWAPDPEDQYPLKATRVDMPTDLISKADAAFIAYMPMHPLWPTWKHPTTGEEPPRPLPLTFELPWVDVTNKYHLANDAYQVAGYFLPEHQGLPMKACVAAINNLALQADGDREGPAAFIKDLRRPKELVHLPNMFPTIGRLIAGTPEPGEEDLHTAFKSLNSDQKKVFLAEGLPYGHLVIHGAPGSGKTMVGLLLIIAIIKDKIDTHKGITKAKPTLPRETRGGLAPEEDKKDGRNKVVITCSENMQGNDLCERLSAEYRRIRKSELKIIRMNTWTREEGYVMNTNRARHEDDFDEVDEITLHAITRDILELARDTHATKKDRRPHGGEFALCEQVLSLMSTDVNYRPAWELIRDRKVNPRAFENNHAVLKEACEKAAEQLLDQADVIVATPTALHTLRSHHPNICNKVRIVLQEEAGRLTEPEWLVAVTACPNAQLRVTAGDPNQSPPLVFGTKAFRVGKSGFGEGTYCQKAQQLATPLMTRWMNCRQPVTRLMKSLRQSGKQEEFISERWYRGDMVSIRDRQVEGGAKKNNAELAADRMFSDGNIIGTPETPARIVIWNAETKDAVQVETSYKNEVHTKLAIDAVRKLQRYGLSSDGEQVPDVGVICPYGAQGKNVRQALNKVPKTDIVHDRVDVRTSRGSMSKDWDYAVVILSRDDRRSGFTSSRDNMVISHSRGKLGTIIIMSCTTCEARTSIGDKDLWAFKEKIDAQQGIWTPERRFMKDYCILCGNSHEANKCRGAMRGKPMQTQLSADDIRARVLGIYHGNKDADEDTSKVAGETTTK